MTVDQLQEYLDNSRRSHDIEGFAGEFIMPNSTLFARENRLYADIVTHEDGEPIWSEPSDWMPATFGGKRTSIWYVAKALSDIGAFSRAGLDIVSEVWSSVDFIGEVECYSVPRNLTQQMLERLHAAGLISQNADTTSCATCTINGRCHVPPRFQADPGASGGSSNSAGGSIAERDWRLLGLLEGRRPGRRGTAYPEQQ